jgi:hypothetical protein
MIPLELILISSLAQTPMQISTQLSQPKDLPARCYGWAKYNSGDFVGANKTVKAMSKTDTIQTLTYVANDTTWFVLDFPQSDTIRFSVEGDSAYIFPNSGDSVNAYVISGKWNETNLKTKSPNPNAVELSSFVTQAYKDRIILNWKTESELNNYMWNIYEGNHQNRIGSIPAVGNSNEPQNYSFEHFCNGSHIYWLGDQDINGNEELHGPIEAATLEQTLAVNNSPFPNPFKNKTRIPAGDPNSIIFVNIYNLLGQNVKNLTGKGFVEWDGSDKNGVKMPNGSYLYEIITKSAQDLNKPDVIIIYKGVLNR